MPDARGVSEIEEDLALANLVSHRSSAARERGDLRGDLGIDGRFAEPRDIEDARGLVSPSGGAAA